MAVAPSGALQFAQLGHATLANILLPDAHAASQYMAQQTNRLLTYKQLETDRYGRASLLVYASDTLTLQEQLLQQGLAIVYTPHAFAKAEDWLAAEAEARQAKRGYWARPDAIVTPDAASQHIGQFALVQGAVTNIYHARDAIYLNFGARWQEDFSIKIPRKAWRATAAWVEALEAHMPPPTDADHRLRADATHPLIVRVRGGVIDENGPMIVVARPEQLEMITPAK